MNFLLKASARSRPTTIIHKTLYRRTFYASSTIYDDRQVGTVVSYSFNQQYGFIDVDGEDTDAFIRRLDIRGAKSSEKMNPILNVGERVQFTKAINPANGKPKATDLTFEDGSEVCYKT